MLTHSLEIAKEIAKGLEMESSKIEKETPKHMEEIKLPKFKTKEELEQFAMGLMNENESLKLVIQKKDETIRVIHSDLSEISRLKSELKIVKFAKELVDNRIKELLEIISKDYYKGKYLEMCMIEKDLHEKINSLNKRIEWEQNRISVLGEMVSFLLEMLPCFKKRRYEKKYGKFYPSNYRY